MLLENKNLGQTFGSNDQLFSHSTSVAINDSLTKEPIFIENSNPETLVEAFVKELTRRQEIILGEVWD